MTLCAAHATYKMFAHPGPRLVLYCLGRAPALTHGRDRWLAHAAARPPRSPTCCAPRAAGGSALTQHLSETCRKPGWTGWTGGWSMDTWRDVDQGMAVRTMHGRLNQRTATQRESRGRVQNIVEHGDLRESHAMQSASVPRTRTTLLRPSVPQAIIEWQRDTSTQPDADTGY